MRWLHLQPDSHFPTEQLTRWGQPATTAVGDGQNCRPETREATIGTTPRSANDGRKHTANGITARTAADLAAACAWVK